MEHAVVLFAFGILPCHAGFHSVSPDGAVFADGRLDEVDSEPGPQGAHAGIDLPDGVQPAYRFARFLEYDCGRLIKRYAGIDISGFDGFQKIAVAFLGTNGFFSRFPSAEVFMAIAPIIDILASWMQTA